MNNQLLENLSKSPTVAENGDYTMLIVKYAIVVVFGGTLTGSSTLVATVGHFATICLRFRRI